MQILKPARLSLADFRSLLAVRPRDGLRFRLPTGSLASLHAHLTEVARVEKRFIDCGGTVRTRVSARIQLWTADDTDHRVDCGKCLSILDRGAGLIESDDLPFEVELDLPYLSLFEAAGSVREGGSLVIILAPAKADCLAPDVCLPAACKPGSGCC
jgi:hypothetical protein